MSGANNLITGANTEALILFAVVSSEAGIAGADVRILARAMRRTHVRAVGEDDVTDWNAAIGCSVSTTALTSVWSNAVTVSRTDCRIRCIHTITNTELTIVARIARLTCATVR